MNICATSLLLQRGSYFTPLVLQGGSSVTPLVPQLLDMWVAHYGYDHPVMKQIGQLIHGTRGFMAALQREKSCPALYVCVCVRVCVREIDMAF